MKDKIVQVGFGMQMFGFALLTFVGIIFWATYIQYKNFPLNFIILYTLFLIYNLLVLISYAKEGRIFEIDYSESLELTRLRMNHSLSMSLFFIAISIPFLSLSNLENNFLIFFLALVVLIFGGYYLFTSYYLRYKRLEMQERVNGIINKKGKA